MRVLVVDDDADLRHLVRLTLELSGGFRIVGEAGDGGEALASAALLRPDVVVLDLGLPDLPGLNVLAELRRVAPQTRVVIFSGLEDHGAETAALSGGASSYVLKNGDMQVLLRALHAVDPLARTATTMLEADLDSPTVARRYVAQLCEEWDMTDLVDDARLVTSELVTNAVRHARTRCRLTVRTTSDMMRIEVGDASGDTPSPRFVDASAVSGRGLYIVASICPSWGVDSTADGKMVWAEISR